MSRKEEYTLSAGKALDRLYAGFPVQSHAQPKTFIGLRLAKVPETGKPMREELYFYRVGRNPQTLDWVEFGKKAPYRLLGPDEVSWLDLYIESKNRRVFATVDPGAQHMQDSLIYVSTARQGGRTEFLKNVLMFSEENQVVNAIAKVLKGTTHRYCEPAFMQFSSSVEVEEKIPINKMLTCPEMIVSILKTHKRNYCSEIDKKIAEIIEILKHRQL